MKIIWLDLLCLSSLLSILHLSFKNNISEIHYLNKTKFCSKTMLKILFYFSNAKISHVTSTSYADNKIAGVSLYELMQLRLTEIVTSWSTLPRIKEDSRVFCKTFSLNDEKYQEYLREIAYYHFYRVIEVFTVSDSISSSRSDKIFIFRDGPFDNIIKTFYKSKRIMFYNSFFLLNRLVKRREDYLYDTIANPYYYFNRTTIQATSLAYAIYAIFASIICLFMSKKPCLSSDYTTNIGVELLQTKIKLDETNDLYWLKDSQINPKSVWGLQLYEYDEKSLDELKNAGINHAKIVTRPLCLLRSILTNRRAGCVHVAMKISDIVELIPVIIVYTLASLLSTKIERSWLYQKKMIYLRNTAYWQSIYRQLNIKFVWSMFDIDPDKLQKAQAIESLNGIFSGSHWSNQPMPRVDHQKCYDVLFTWSEYFKNYIFSEFPHLATFYTGYPLDFYFKSKEVGAMQIRNRHCDKFILSYHDNITAYDLMFSQQGQIAVYEVLISLLEEHEQLIVLLKPKRNNLLHYYLSKLPKLNNFIKERRVEVFTGDSPSTKMPPATVGLASDLALGLGTSTAATECSFVGTVSFFIDLAKFDRNYFVKTQKNKFVFQDLAILKLAITNQIENRTYAHNDFVNALKILDPFQDGKAALRTGHTIKTIQNNLQKGSSRQESIDIAVNDYNNLLNNCT